MNVGNVVVADDERGGAEAGGRREGAAVVARRDVEFVFTRMEIAYTNLSVRADGPPGTPVYIPPLPLWPLCGCDSPIWKVMLPEPSMTASMQKDCERSTRMSDSLAQFGGTERDHLGAVDAGSVRMVSRDKGRQAQRWIERRFGLGRERASTFARQHGIGAERLHAIDQVVALVVRHRCTCPEQSQLAMRVFARHQIDGGAYHGLFVLIQTRDRRCDQCRIRWKSTLARSWLAPVSAADRWWDRSRRVGRWNPVPPRRFVPAPESRFSAHSAPVHR